MNIFQISSAFEMQFNNKKIMITSTLLINNVLISLVITHRMNKLPESLPFRKKKTHITIFIHQYHNREKKH